MKPGYFDRVVKIKSHGQMMELLNERTKKPVEGGSTERGVVQYDGGSDKCQSPLPDGAKPSVTPAALTWRDPVKGVEALLSTCGRYSVARAKCDGVYRYTAYSRLPTPAIIGEVQSDAGSAQRLCNDHWLATQ